MLNSIINKSHIIVGGGPVGSSLARILSHVKKNILIFDDFDDYGSHNDVSRLGRLSVDGNKDELAASREAIRDLVTLNRLSSEKIITSKPGIIFAASYGTEMYSKIKNTSATTKELTKLTDSSLKKLFPGYKFNFPKDLTVWYSPDGYVINPKELVKTNLKIAKSKGCMIIDGKASLEVTEEGYLVKNNNATYKTRKLYILAGAKNKELFEANDIENPSINSIYLTAISTMRYKSVIPEESGLMPIVLGHIKNSNHDKPICFSAMPESLKTVKLRVSGPPGTEVIEKTEEKNKLDDGFILNNYYPIVSKFFPFLKNPYGFSRCITYRNKAQIVNGFTFNKVAHLEEKKYKKQLYTTLGCYGVHVKYSSIIANAIYKSMIKCNKKPFVEDIIIYPSDNYFKNQFPHYEIFFKKTDILKKIGNTPLKKINENIFLKLEGENYTGSIKDRVALYVLLKKIKNKTILNKISLVVASSGSYALSLLKIKEIFNNFFKIEIRLIIICPSLYKNRNILRALRHSKIKESYINNQIHKSDIPPGDIVLYNDGDFSESMLIAKKIGDFEGVLLLDQQYDLDHVKAHTSTASEINKQLPNVTDIVAVVGTGATATGLNRFFSKKVKIHAMPSAPGSIPGLSDPSTYNNFFKKENFFSYSHGRLDPEVSTNQQSKLKIKYGLKVGESTGAALSIAEKIKIKDPHSIIAVISASKV